MPPKPSGLSGCFSRKYCADAPGSMKTLFEHCGFAGIALLLWFPLRAASASPAGLVSASFPDREWEFRSPEDLGLSRDKLFELQQLVGGRGCVVRNGYMAFTWGDQHKSGDIASAMKPVLTTLLFLAVR